MTFDFEDDLADEIIARVGNQQYRIREEQVADLDDWEDELYEMESEEELGVRRTPAQSKKIKKEKARKKKAEFQKMASKLGYAKPGTTVDAAGVTWAKPTAAADKGAKLRAYAAAVKANQARRAAAAAARPMGFPAPGPRPMAYGAPRMPAQGGFNLERFVRASGQKAGISGAQMESMLKVMAGAKATAAARQVRGVGGPQPHLDRVARQIEANLDPKLKAITLRLRRAAVQRGATSEHNAITKRAAYRRRVLKTLAAIMRQLPKGHPLRTQSVRALGNVLGSAGLVVARPKQ